MFSTLLISFALFSQCPNCVRNSQPLSETVKVQSAGFRGMECTQFIFPTEQMTENVIEEMRKDKYNNIESGDTTFHKEWEDWKSKAIKNKTFLTLTGEQAQRVFGYITKVSNRNYISKLETNGTTSD